MRERNVPFFWFGGGLACETRKGEKKDKKNVKLCFTAHLLLINYRLIVS